jgi:hypothetical protein
MFLIAPASATAQQTILSSELSRLSGTEASSHIEYVRLFLRGSLLSHPTVSANGKASSLNVSAQPGIAGASDGATAVVLPSSDFAAASVPTKEPMLIAQCTRGASGKLAFELLANFGGVDDLAYYPPWTPADSHDLFPPQLQKPNMTMEFLGYTHVKPVKRQWEALLQPVGQYRYNPPSGGSANMEDSTYYLRYLLALPTLHLTLMEKTAEFRTTPLLDQIRREPLCKASLL